MYDVMCAHTLADKEFQLKWHKFMQYFSLVKLHNSPGIKWNYRYYFPHLLHISFLVSILDLPIYGIVFHFA